MELKDVRIVAISGAGTMGSGIAQIFARKGYKVILADIKDEFLEKSRSLIEVFNSSLVEEELMTKEEEAEVYKNIEFTTDVRDFKDADIVIEAIVEKLPIKQDYWKEIEGICRQDTIFATNTSGLSVNDISEKVEKKDRFIGTHFWNPAHIIPLVELIRADKTSDETVELLKEVMDVIDKVSVVVLKDAYGFIGNRLQFAAFREAVNIVERGIASPEDVDKAMKYGPGFRYPLIGPLETADLGGLDTFYNISSYLFEDLADTKKPQEILQKLIDRDELGVKSKKGFYDYADGRDDEAIKKRDKKLFEMLKYIYEK